MIYNGLFFILTYNDLALRERCSTSSAQASMNTLRLLLESEYTVPSVVTSGGSEECLLKLLLKEFKVDQKILLSLGLFNNLLV